MSEREGDRESISHALSLLTHTPSLSLTLPLIPPTLPHSLSSSNSFHSLSLSLSLSHTQAVIDAGNKNRTTHATESNDESSRSHAICQISLYDTSKITAVNTYGSIVGR